MKRAFKHVENPRYRGLLVFTQRRQAIDFALTQQPLIVAYFRGLEMTFRFPSGAVVELAVAYDERDVIGRFAGKEYQFIGFMNPEQVSSDARYFLRCRLREAGTGIEPAMWDRESTG